MDELDTKIVEVEVVENGENFDLNVQNEVEVIHKQSPSHTKCERIGAQIRDMARMGLTRGNVAIAARISPYILDKYYADEYASGEGEMRKGLATVAMAEALNGNTAILLHLVKTKLGWNETQLIQHSGEVRSVVSAKPLSKEEFAEKFLNKE
jgi:hypothetical protein